MAHFAEIGPDNVVQRVIVFEGEGPDGEAACAAFMGGGTWKQTSYNGTTRKNFAGQGMLYDHVRDAFYHQQPFPSWTLDEATCRWVPPVPRPDPETHGLTVWNEQAGAWEAP